MISLGREPHPVGVPGTAEHAATVTEGRDQRVHDALQWLTYAHLPVPLVPFSQPFYQAACTLIFQIATDSDELVLALQKLIEAKDSAVRAGIKHQTGRAGSIPRTP